MAHSPVPRTDVHAAQSLIRWKATFAEEVCKHAEQLAAGAHVISASHYREAAKLALKTLETAIEAESASDANQAA